MKRIMICAALVCASTAWGQQSSKAYDNIKVVVTSTLVNQHGVRFIYAKSDEFSFVLTCNANNGTCTAPQLGASYDLEDVKSLQVYRCDEYGMIRASGGTDVVLVCLQNVSTK